MFYIKYFIAISVIVGFLIAIYLLFSFKINNKIRRKIKEMFGAIPNNEKCKIESISNFYKYMCKCEDTSDWIDSITWNDLDMDDIFKRINACCSSVGEEYLYQMLHTLKFNPEDIENQEKLIAYLESNPKLRVKLQVILYKLGKKNFNGVASFIGSNDFRKLKYTFIYNILAIVPLIGIVIIPFNNLLGILILINSFMINIYIYYYIKKKIDCDLCSLNYFSAMLYASKKICAIKDDNFAAQINDLKESYMVFKSFSGKFSGVMKKVATELDFLIEYINILFLMDIRNYNKLISSISKNMPSFKKLFYSLGHLDACISIMSYRESVVCYCNPEFHSSNAMDISGLVHPLLKNPVANDAEINKNIIITGSNASGKSTFIRSVAINSILAQTINTCTARSFVFRPALIMSSMAVRDNVTEGDSYFIKEIKSLKRILDKIQERYCICFVDEILKGTNTIERIAASSAVLKSACTKDCLFIVASHDIELTEILKNEYNNKHFSEYMSDEGMKFDYKIKEGPSQTRNAIKLLHYMKFDDELVENAENLVDKFVKDRRWTDV